MISSASVMIVSISSAQVGMSWIRPWQMPALQIPASGSPCLVDLDAARAGDEVLDVLEAAPRASRSPGPPGRPRCARPARCCAACGRSGRSGARRPRRSARLMFSWIGDSTVHMKRVPMLIASAPSASAATRPRASAKPPEAMIGIFSLSAAAGISTSPGTSSSPGMAGAVEAVDRDRVDAERLGLERVAHRRRLVDHLDPGGLEHRAGTRSGCCPAVSTNLTPESMIACAYSR